MPSQSTTKVSQAAAAKLKELTHGQTPPKSNQQPAHTSMLSKLQSGANHARRSRGQGPGHVTPVIGTNTSIGNTATEGLEEVQGQTTSPPTAANSGELEPSIKDILQAINSCKFSIDEISPQLKTMQEELTLVRHDMQKVRGRMTALEGRVSTLEDDVNPIKREMDIIKEQMTNYQLKFDEMENRIIGRIYR